MNDLILVKNIQQNVNVDVSLARLYDLHSGIYYKMVNSYISNSNKSLKEELFKECKYHIYFACRSFDFKRKIKFSTYLGNTTRWMCLNINFKNKKTLNYMDVFDSNDDTIEDNFNLIDKINKKEIFEKVFKTVDKESDERLRRIFFLRYVKGNKNKVMPWKNIGKEVGLSIQGCINIHNAFIKKIQKTNDK